MAGQGKSVYGPLPFSYLAGKDSSTATSGVGLRKEGVYESAADIYTNRSNTRMVSGRDTSGRDSGLGRSNHGTGERGYYPADGDPETGIGYTNHAQDDLDISGSKAHMGSTMDNFILKKGPNDLSKGQIREEESPPSPGGARGEPISSDFYNPPPARDTNIDRQPSPHEAEVVDDLEKIPKHRPTIFSMIQESEKLEREREKNHDVFSSGLGGYSSFQEKHEVRPSTSSDEFNTMIRTDSYFDKKQKKQCSMCCAVITAIVIAFICLGLGFVAGWFVYPIVNANSSTDLTTTGSMGAGERGISSTASLPIAGQSTTTTTLKPTTKTTTTTTTQPPVDSPTTSASQPVYTTGT